MNLSDMKISARLILGFAIMGFLIMALGGVALWKSTAIQDDFRTVTGERIPRVAMLNEVKGQIDRIAIALRNMALVEEEADQKLQQSAVFASRQKIAELLGRLKTEIATPRGKELLGAIEAQRARYIEAQNRFMTQVGEGNAVGARSYLLTEVRPILDAYTTAVDALIAFQAELLDQSVKDTQAQVLAIQNAVWISIVLALVVAGILATWIIRAITVPLQRAVGVARAVAGGDLGVQIQAQGRNETAQLLHALQQMLQGLRSVVSQVRSGSEGVASASSQIAQANNDLSARTEQQASALQQTAASMEQLNSTVRQNADNARQANQLAMSATTVAERGGAVVGQVVQTMKGINESSQRIADIIQVIDGIAFQTNILALNAAVEAARAGEQGRGFAVVASEVRTLAKRSADAAHEIKQLIHASVERVAQGTELVNSAGGTMQQTVQAIGRVAALVSDISAAAAEQSTGMGQIGEAVQHLDQTTQQNAALVEELTAAARSLQDQAAAQVRTLAVFTLAGEANAMPVHATPASAAAHTLVALRAPVQRPALAA